jgi:hypothetical protein
LRRQQISSFPYAQNDSLMTKSIAYFLLAASVSVSLFVPGLGIGSVHAESSLDSFDPDRVGWSRIDMSASKMLLSMRVTVELSRTADDLSDGRLRTPLKGLPVPSGDYVIAMRFDSEGLGRRSDVELLLNADNGAALQRVSDDSGSKLRRRIYRFTDIGAYRWTWKPLSGEDALGPDAWSGQESKFRPFPVLRPHQPVTEAGGLIYLVAASRLENPGDHFEIFAFSSSSDEVQHVRVEVMSSKRTRVNYKEVTATGKIRQKKRMDLIRVRILGVPANSNDDEEFELLGLRQVELLIDPLTRAPLELSGKVPFFGRVTFHLDELTPAM